MPAVWFSRTEESACKNTGIMALPFEHNAMPKSTTQYHCRWAALFFVGPLPPEVIASIYEALLVSNYQVIEVHVHMVNDQIHFSALISACGIEHVSLHFSNLRPKAREASP